MNCELLQEDLCAYADNELEPVDQAGIEAHVAACEACAEELQAIRSVKAVVGRLRLLREDPPGTLTVLPDVEEAPEPQQTTAWWRRPIPGRVVALAAAAVLVALVFSYAGYERRFLRQSQARDAVVAHLSGLASEQSQVGSGDGMAVSLPAVKVGRRMALQTVYRMGRHDVSALRLPAGEFDASHLDRYEVMGRECRAGRVGRFSVAACDSGSTQVVLVSDCAPEALVALAQNIPLAGPTGPEAVGY